MARKPLQLLWMVPLAALVGWSLVQQARRPETLGERMIRALAHTDPSLHLRGAVPVVEYFPVKDEPAAVSLAKRPWVGGLVETWEGPGVRLVLASSTDEASSPLRSMLLAPDLAGRVQAALERLDFYYGKPRELVESAQGTLLAMNEAQLLEAFLQADVATLETADDAETVVRQALLLLAWDPRSAVMAHVNGGQLQLIETVSCANETQATVFYVNAHGAKRWHGTLTRTATPRDANMMATLCRWASDSTVAP